MIKIMIIVMIIIAIVLITATVFIYEEINRLKGQTIEAFKKMCEEIKEDDRR